MDASLLQACAALLPYPDKDANKYSRGTLVVIAGSQAYPGAACLAAAAGARAGAGYVRVFTHPDTVAKVQCAMPSLVAAPLDRLVRAEPWKGFGERPSRPQACVVGPGFDATEEGLSELLAAALRMPAPVVVDGGALALCGAAEMRSLLAERLEAGLATVLTPHAGEAARLAAAAGLTVGCTAARTAGDGAADEGTAAGYEGSSGEALAMALADAYASIVVLKGPVTFVASCSGALLMDEGTPALAKAGTGDVLAGTIGALFAQAGARLDVRIPADAATARMLALLGTVLHARAGRIAADDIGSISVVAEDVLAALPRAICGLGKDR